jgi:hypothetical protein
MLVSTFRLISFFMLIGDQDHLMLVRVFFEKDLFASYSPPCLTWEFESQWSLDGLLAIPKQFSNCSFGQCFCTITSRDHAAQK